MIGHHREVEAGSFGEDRVSQLSGPACSHIIA
jgi:hypothetical protein